MKTRSPPVLTFCLLSVTALVTGAAALDSRLAGLLRRDPSALVSGEWWRLVTPLFVQADPLWATLGVFAGFAVIGVAAEWRFGRRRWLILYVGGGLAGEVTGYVWGIPGSGASVAVAGLLGGLLAWLTLDWRVYPWRIRACGGRSGCSSPSRSSRSVISTGHRSWSAHSFVGGVQNAVEEERRSAR